MNLFFKLSIVILLFFTFSSCSSFYKNLPKARNGTINISGWDFARDGNLNLDGEWEFYWEKLLENNNIPEYENDRTFLKFPGTWNMVRTSNDLKINGQGYATYRLRVTGLTQNNTLKIFIKNMATSYRLFINDVEIQKTGTVGTNRKDYVPKMLPVLKDIPVRGDFNIILQVANFHYINGGSGRSITIGMEESIERYFLFNMSIDWFFIGISMIIGINHLFLFIVRKKDMTNLLFGLFCLIISLRTISVEGLISSYFPGYNLFDILLKMEYLSISFALPVLLTFVKYIFRNDSKNKILTGFQITSIIYSLVIIFSPSWLIPKYTLSAYHVVILLGIIYGMILIIRTLAAKNNLQATIIFLSCCFLAITMLNDIAYGQGLIQTGFIIQYGLFGFIIAQSIALSIIFASTFNKYEELTRTLEQKVYERTSELRKAKDNIERLSEQRSNYFINFAHETKTPVTIIKNFFDRYVEKREKTDLDILGRNIDKLKDNLAFFLTVEKINSGNMRYNHKGKILNLSELMKSNLLHYSDLAKCNNIDISFDIDGGIYVESDRNALSIAIGNIIDNAIKYTDRNGKVSVSLKIVDDKIYLKVKDNGIGIGKEQVKNIFIPFYQIENKKENRQGIGFGLFIVKNIVDSLSGIIEIKSKENEGTEFTIMLNLHKLDKNDELTELISPRLNYDFFKPELKPEIYRTGLKTILVVEDNKDLLYFIQDKLYDQYNVYYSYNGKEALEKLADIPMPDLIISDIMMDTMDGMEFFNKIKSDDKFDHIPFVFLSAKTQDKLEGLEQGAVDFIEKPFSMPELLAKIEAILNMQTSKINFGKLAEYDFNATEDRIIRLIIKGLQNKEIAYELNTTENYVKKLVTGIFKKTNTTNRQLLIRIFM